MLVVLGYLDNMFINKLKTKSNGVLNRVVSNTEEFTVSLEEQELNKCLQKFISGQENVTAVRSFVCHNIFNVTIGNNE